MPIDSVSSFIDVLGEKRFLPPDQFDELNRALRPRFSDVKTLAKYLAQRGWLTVYQVNQILIGRAQDLVYGPYLIHDRIGEGGVSQVFKAWHTEKNCMVALKVIRQELLSNPEALLDPSARCMLSPACPTRTSFRASTVTWSARRTFSRWNMSKGPTWVNWCSSPAPLRFRSPATIFVRRPWACNMLTSMD